MRLKVLTPTDIILDTKAIKILAEAVNGYFCIKPRHSDFVTALVPGILEYTTEQNISAFVALDNGTLVKCADSVMISARNAICGTDLSELRTLIEQKFNALDEHEKHARTVMARLEAGIVRRFIELGEMR